MLFAMFLIFVLFTIIFCLINVFIWYVFILSDPSTHTINALPQNTAPQTKTQTKQ